MTITILTLFPDFFVTPFQSSIIKRALETQKITIQVINIRDFALDKHKVTDDRPFGGGPGMVMKVEPIEGALASIGASKGAKGKKILLTSAKGSAFTQKKAQEFSQLEEVIIICGHYEGVDERVAENLIDEEIRIGEYVLTGGEPAALVMADAIARLVPGVLGNEASPMDESHTESGVLGFPQYTRPEEYKGWKVPEVLLTGNHAVIQEWRAKQKKREKNSEKN